MVELIVLRHGRTDWNASRRIQGQLDSQLDEIGHAQARAVAQVIAEFKPDLIWASDSDRASTTASYVAAACGLELVRDARLREFHLGHIQGMYHHELASQAPDAYAEFFASNWDAVDGVEKQAEVAARTSAAIADVIASTPEDGLAVVVSHGAAIRTAIAALLDWPLSHALTLGTMDNCGWALLKRPNPDAPWRLRAYNRTVEPTGGTLAPS